MPEDPHITPHSQSVKKTLGAPDRRLAEQFEFLGLLDSGGMGVIYKARNITINQIVAIKMIQAGDLDDRHVQRFRQEARALSNLNHYNIVQVKDFGFTENAQPYMVLEFIEGMTLSQFIKQQQTVSLEKLRSIFTQVTDALSHAHEHGVLHRDLKPSNIMIKTAADGAPLVKIVDFGIAKMLTAELNSALTRTGETIGSPAYMSPEQISGSPQDARTDIYSLGCVMFEALTGATPFQAENATELAFRQMNADVPNVRDRANQPISESLAAIVTKCLQKDPGQRFQSMADLGAALSETQFTEQPKDHYRLLKRSILYASVVLMIFIAGSIIYLIYEKIEDGEKKKLRREIQSVNNVLELSNVNTVATPNDYVQRSIRDNRNQESMQINDACNDDALIEFTKGNFATKSINLSNAEVKGPGLAYLIRLPLETLELQRSSLTDRGLLEISKMKSLTYLVIDADKVTSAGLNYLSDNPQLKKLSARDLNTDDEGLKSICKISTLVSLQFDGNPRVTDIGYSHLPELKHLEIFTTREIHVTDKLIDTLLQMQSLARIYFDSTDITDRQLKLLSKSKTIKAIHLERNEKLSAVGLKYILTIPGIGAIDLRGNKWVTDSTLKSFEVLHHKFNLSVEDTQVTDAGMRILANTSISSVDIVHTPVTGAGLLELTKAKGLEEIRLTIGDPISTADLKKFALLRPDVQVDKAMAPTRLF